MKKAIFKEISPKHPLLRQHIKTYYVKQSNAPDFKETYTYYPNITTTLNLYKNSRLQYAENSRSHQNDATAKPLKLLVAKINKSRTISTDGPFNKLSIVFHPLGLNHFVAKPLGQFIKDHFSFFDYFGEGFDDLIPSLFAAATMEEKRDLLDAFFLERYHLFEEQRLLDAIQLIHAENGVIKVSDLAKKLSINRKTLLRLFQKHLAYSVEEYLSVVKFRKTLNAYQEKIGKPKLTELTYEGGYYDQPDFNRQFKAKTGLKPSQLFDQIDTIAKGLYWNYS